MKNKSTISDYVDGLYVKDGRLINGRSEPEIGLSKMAKARKMMKKQEKIQMMSEAIELADLKKKMRGF